MGLSKRVSKRRRLVALIFVIIVGILGSFCAPALGAMRGCKDGRLRGGSRDIYLINAPSAKGQPPAPDPSPIRLTTGANDANPSWSPPDPYAACDTTIQPPPGYTPRVPTIAFQRTTADGNTNIYRIDAATPEPTGHAIQVTHDMGADTAPAWAPYTFTGAPNLTYPPIAFERMVNGHHDIFIANSDGSDETDLTNSTGADFANPDWLPARLSDYLGAQTAWLAFDSNQGGRREVWVMNVEYDAGNPPGQRYVDLGLRDLTLCQPASFDPSWYSFSDPFGDPGPKFDQIAFAGPDQDGSPTQIDIADGTAASTPAGPFAVPGNIEYSALTSDSPGNSAPAWAPTGDFIAYQKTAGTGTSDIYVLNPTSNDETTDVDLTQGLGDNRDPDWEPVQIVEVDVFPIRPLGRRHRKRLAESDVSPQATPPSPLPSTPTQPPPPLPPAFSARLLSMTTIGHGPSRTVLIRLHLNAAATVTAVLAQGDRRWAKHHWQIAAGADVVRLPVPPRVRPGIYQVHVTVQPANGPPQRFSRRVHLGR